MARAETQSPTEEEADWRSPWASNSDRFPDDQLLRRFKFVLVSRGKREPCWRHGNHGQVVTQSQALAMVDAAQRKALATGAA